MPGNTSLTVRRRLFMQGDMRKLKTRAACGATLKD